MINCLSGNTSRSVGGGLRVTEGSSGEDFLLLLLLLVIKLAAVQLLSWTSLFDSGEKERFDFIQMCWEKCMTLDLFYRACASPSRADVITSRRPRKTELNRKCVFLESDL